ncbi:MAG TPA: hypothetical protein VHM70_21440 [Polyangiaceae bacterium]|nr:hypothetical protein [Polyangiaceae bacterium]
MRALLPCAAITLLSLATACGGKTQDDTNNTAGTRADDGEPGSNKPSKGGGKTPVDDADGGTTLEDAGSVAGGSKPTDKPEPGGPTPASGNTTPGNAESPSETTSTPVTSNPVPVGSSKPPDAMTPAPVTFGPPPPDAPAPMDCMEGARTTSTGYCQLSLSCSNDNLSSNCTAQPDGTYACSCNSNAAYGNYVLSGVDDANACDSALELCKGGTTIQFGTDVTCQEPMLMQFTGACQLMQQCGTSAAVSDTVTAYLYDTHYASCSDDGDGRLSCSCSTNSVSRDYTLTGESLDTACQTALDLCTGDAPPVGPSATCTPVVQSDTKSDCQLQNQCESSAPVGDGSAVVVNDYQSSSCTVGADGTWSCSCSTSTRSLSFQLSDDQEVDDRCASVLGVCTGDAAPEPSGEITCETTSQTASGDYCSTQVTCTQNASVGDLEIGLLGGLSTSCQRASDGMWNCGCSSGVVSVSYDVEGDDGWAACTAASATCSDQVTVQIGTGSSGTGSTGAGGATGMTPPPGLK